MEVCGRRQEAGNRRYEMVMDGTKGWGEMSSWIGTRERTITNIPITF